MEMNVFHFFDKMPEAIPLYEAVKRKILENLENVEINIQKSQIAFSTKRGFAYVWLPIRKIKNRPQVYIILSFALNYQIQDSRILESVEPYKERWMHHIIIQEPADIDDQLMSWLKAAHEFSQR